MSIRNLIFYTLNALPSWASIRGFKLLADVRYFAYAYLLKPWEQRLKQNLDILFPGISENEKRKLIKSYYRHLCDTRIEPIILSKVPGHKISEYVQYKNPEILENIYSQHKNILLLIYHYANWEYVVTISGFTKHQCFTTSSVYKKSANIHEKLRAMRGKFGVTVLNQANFYRTSLKKDHKNLCLYGVLADWRPQGHFTDTVNFLNTKRPIAPGPFRMFAANDNTAVVIIHSQKRGRFSYTLELEVVEKGRDGDDNFMQYFFSRLEGKIKSKPELWIELAHYDLSKQEA